MKQNKRKSIGQIIKKVLWKNKTWTFFLLFFIAGTILLGVTPPLVLEQAINLLGEKKGIPLALALLYFTLTAIGGIFDAVKELMITVIGQKITYSIRGEMAQKLTKLPASYYAETDSGVTVSRFTGDVDTLEKLFTSGIVSMVVDAFKVISILVVIFIKSRGLGILMIVVTPVLYILTRVVQKRVLEAQIDHRRAVGHANQHIPETLKNLRTIHVLQKETYMEERYDKYIQESFQAMERSNFYDAIYSPVIITISTMIVAVMMVMAAQGGVFLDWFGMSVGTAVAVIAYVGKVFDPLESIGMEIQNIQSAMAGVRRITEFFEEEERLEDNIENITLLKTEPAISVTDVTFGYRKENKILNHFSCTIAEGEQLVLSGRTGVGKSTLFKLILGMYEPESGEVKIFGVPAGQIPDRQKRRIFGYVEQNFRPIPGTIADQITLGDDEITSEMVWNALEIIGLSHVVAQMSDKEQTLYREELFSQGQQQLLSIARAIVARPQILLLDEITANLDSDTEAKVLQALQKASKHRTVLSISHRLYGNYSTAGDGGTRLNRIFIGETSGT